MVYKSCYVYNNRPCSCLSKGQPRATYYFYTSTSIDESSANIIESQFDQNSKIKTSEKVIIENQNRDTKDKATSNPAKCIDASEPGDTGGPSDTGEDSDTSDTHHLKRKVKRGKKVKEGKNRKARKNHLNCRGEDKEKGKRVN
ncbi:hypothetical protein L873DRAFT_1331129 [Choiromyces venosus 120613-1]|uniref:Uncharacterized protein n=1 Tax=Choiromyces venosus 120613-1 TaxID=1336337 RepID=A0A3N4JAG4_9PEZI|nr:hypothetical protein L873DRAFT_1331129 [Choiromyces venosus 120613-1]